MEAPRFQDASSRHHPQLGPARHRRMEPRALNLTIAAVESAPTRQTDYFIWDKRLPGFGVRIFPSGRRRYVIQYRSDGRTKRFALGWHGPQTLEQARRLAREKLGTVAGGGDPAAEREERRNALTVKDLAERYLAAAEKGLVLGRHGHPKRASTIMTDRSRLSAHILPLLGCRTLDSLARADVMHLLEQVTVGATAADKKIGPRRRSIVRGGTGTASKAVSLLGAMCNWAVDHGLMASNPAAKVRRPKDGKRSRRLTPAECAGLGAALARLREEEKHRDAADVIELVALTGLRKSEALRLRWEHLEPAAGRVLLLSSKASPEPTYRPAGAEAFSLLRRRGEACGREVGWVFPAAFGTGPRTDVQDGLEAALGYAELRGVTLHTLRHTYASEGMTICPLPVLALLLGHSTVDGADHLRTTLGYAHASDEEVSAATFALSARIRALLDGAPAHMPGMPAAGGGGRAHHGGRKILAMVQTGDDGVAEIALADLRGGPPVVLRLCTEATCTREREELEMSLDVAEMLLGDATVLVDDPGRLERLLRAAGEAVGRVVPLPEMRPVAAEARELAGRVSPGQPGARIAEAHAHASQVVASRVGAEGRARWWITVLGALGAAAA